MSAFAGYDMYHSSYGPTVDGLQKPEAIAPGIWVAAPILPGTPTAAQAQLLATLAGAHDGELKAIIEAHQAVDGDLDGALSLEPPLIRQLVAAKMKGNNVISGTYKHVDGTSFAAPIVSSIAAQMIEANPALAPQEIKRRLPDRHRAAHPRRVGGPARLGSGGRREGGAGCGRGPRPIAGHRHPRPPTAGLIADEGTP